MKIEVETFNTEQDAKDRVKQLRKRKYTISWSDFWKCYTLVYNRTQ
jgi:hypothetical protein